MFFFKNYAENEAGKLALFEVNASGLQLDFTIC